MEVIYCKVGEPAKLVEIEGKLEDFQKMVGGHIEVVSYEGISGLVYVLNEEGKLEGLKPNKIHIRRKRRNRRRFRRGSNR